MTTRRLAASLAADVVGFLAMMERTRRGRYGGSKRFIGR
jgi:hypothetical protein